MEKSKYMLLGGKTRVKEFGELDLGIDGKSLDKGNNYNYFGAIIGENLSRTDHVESYYQEIKEILYRETVAIKY